MVAISMGTKGPYATTKEIEASPITITITSTSLIVIEQELVL
jgi:hypothetical protein